MEKENAAYNKEHLELETEESVDSVTKFDSFPEAEKKMQELFSEYPSEQFHVAMIDLYNIDDVAEEYGFSFCIAVIKNISIMLEQYFLSCGDNPIISRISKGCFSVFMQDADAREFEDKIHQIAERLEEIYFGRNTTLDPQIRIGIYHLKPGEKEVQAVFDKVECALYHGAQQLPVVVTVYEEGMQTEDSQLCNQSMLNWPDADQMVNFDHDFVSFAAGLLSDSRDLDSSTDMLLQHTGWKFHFDDVMLAEFEGNNLMRVTNKWTRDKGVLSDITEVANIDLWDGFMTSFGDEGISVVPDISTVFFSKNDQLFFKERGFEGYINILLYDNSRPIGYLSCTVRKAQDCWSYNTVNSLLQLSKLISSFMALRIQKRKDKKKIEDLSREELTGLYQYAAFQRKVQKLLRHFDTDKTYAFSYSDISNFSYLNENFGYQEGNKVLREFARRIKQDNEEHVILSRLEADRFIIFSVRDSRSEIENRVRKVNTEFTEYLQNKYPQSDLYVTTGIYFVEQPNYMIFRMVDAANHARKHVKKQHFDTIGVFTDELKAQRKKVLDVVGSVQDAIKEGQIEAFLQPKFSMNYRTVTGAEALVRWRNSDGTYRYPDQFIPILEDAGFIVDVDMCVYEQVLKALVKWQKDKKKLVPVSVNFSRLHFKSLKGFEKIIDMAKQYGIDSKYIEIEITESTFVDNRTDLYRQMSVLRQSGFRIDIDDFGTGYSSLNMLLSAPVDIVKVDKSFIDHYESQEQKEYINQIGNLILSAKKDIIFEGVETEEQIDLLTNYGYDKAQGYLFSKPIPLAEFEQKYIYA
ncbi:MAG: EAL domain-containing protein [Clostridiaceae bacterium]|nr:EAL domain-containing protein [Clostridiaceae bacterium]